MYTNVDAKIVKS